MVFDIQLGKVVESVMKDAKGLKIDKKNVATMIDHFDKQLYYVLTSEQFDLMLKENDALHENDGVDEK